MDNRKMSTTAGVLLLGAGAMLLLAARTPPRLDTTHRSVRDERPQPTTDHRGWTCESAALLE